MRMTIRAPLKLYAFSLLLIVIAFLLAGVALFGSGLAEATSGSAKRFGADLMVVPAGAETPLGAVLIGGVPLRLLLPDGAEASVAVTPGVRMTAPQYFLSSAQASCCEAGNMLLIGFDPQKDFTVRPWLPTGELKTLAGGDVLVGGGVMKGTGADLRLYNRLFRVAARMEKSGLGYFDNAVFIPLAGVAAMERSSRGSGAVPLTVSWGRPSMLLLQLLPQTDMRETAASIEKRVPGVRVLTIPELFREKRELLKRIADVQIPLSVAAWIAAMAAGGAMQFLYWRGRRPTLGLLQAWGYGKGFILLLFSMETMLLSLAAMVAGSLVAFLLLRLFAAYFAVALGLPLLLGTAAAAAAGIPWLCLSFAVVMAGETLAIILFLLRHEPADLMRGA